MTTDCSNDNPRARDILAEYEKFIKPEFFSEIVAIENQFRERPHWEALRDCLSKLPQQSEAKFRQGAGGVRIQGNCLHIGSEATLTAEERRFLEQAVELLIPWRKGPFTLCGLEIDSEWRSNLKWDRIEALLGDIRGLRIADVGCGNGYYMLRAAQFEPECLLGFDPSEAFFYAFNLLERFVPYENMRYIPLGWEALESFSEFFDVVICMGVLYHQKDPFAMLQSIRNSLRPEGRLILESQVMEGEESVALFPPARYAKARNVYSVPTVACIETWMKHSGFNGIQRGPLSKVTIEEQRSTPLAPYESLVDFLDPLNSSITVEGHPAPWRGILVGNRGA